MKTVVSSKGQIVLPAERDRIRPGQPFDIERLRAGHYLLTKRAGPDDEGVVDWMFACPVEGLVYADPV